MAKTLSVAPGKLAEVIMSDAKVRNRGVRTALRRAAQRGKELLQSATPVDQTTMIKAWKVTVREDGSLLVTNDAPHAGVIERGAKPHPVGTKVVKILADWAARHGMEDPEAAAWGIAKKIEKEGSKAHWIVRDSKDELLLIMHEELERV